MVSLRKSVVAVVDEADELLPLETKDELLLDELDEVATLKLLDELDELDELELDPVEMAVKL